jgi:hypothetical protein
MRNVYVDASALLADLQSEDLCRISKTPETKNAFTKIFDAFDLESILIAKNMNCQYNKAESSEIVSNRTSLNLIWVLKSSREIWSFHQPCEPRLVTCKSST